ncbi:MAG: urea transporter [Magnetococcales bacterium]|nr:urea transporter [Magnetococcales bacterium]
MTGSIHLAQSLLRRLSAIFFLSSPLVGFLVVIVLSINPWHGIGGGIAVVSAIGFARVLDQSPRVAEGLPIYNALLSGLAVTHLLTPGPIALFFLIFAGIGAVIVELSLGAWLWNSIKVSVLSLPFVLVTVLLDLVARTIQPMYGAESHTVSSAVWAGPEWLSGFFVSMGAILFSPEVLSGMIICAGLLMVSPILLVLAFSGYLLGVVTHGFLLGSPGPVFQFVSGFNYALTAMALGGVFLIPSAKSFVMAAIGVLVAVLVTLATIPILAVWTLPVLTLPFNMTVLLFVHVLGLSQFKFLTKEPLETPEKSLQAYLSQVWRFSGEPLSLSLPFSGQWMVWQGFDGSWTHQGLWRYALDFILVKEGRSFSGSGEKLTDYWAYRKPVFSPCSGRIVRVISHLPDNPPGTVDKVNNWGNLVIIKMESSLCVELSHFAQDSIRIQEGAWVDSGTMLGYCGNSGYSPQPHIHMQVQRTEQIGAATIAFGIHNFLRRSHYVPNAIPKQNEMLEPLQPERALLDKTNFILDQKIYFQPFCDGVKQKTVTWTVRMAVGGETYFDSGRGKLYFACCNHRFYFYRLEGHDPWLALMFAALPMLPLVYRPGMRWQDHPPLSVLCSLGQRIVLGVISPFNHQAALADYQAGWHAYGYIKGRLKQGIFRKSLKLEVVLSEDLGLKQIRLGDQMLCRAMEVRPDLPPLPSCLTVK